MTVENLLIASYIVSVILMGVVTLNSYNAMRRSEALLDDLRDKND